MERRRRRLRDREGWQFMQKRRMRVDCLSFGELKYLALICAFEDKKICALL